MAVSDTAMELLVALFAMLIPPSAIVAAVNAWRALSQDPADTHKLRLAAWFLAVPWLGVVMFGGPPAISGLFAAGLWSVVIVASSLAVGVAVVGAWTWRRYQLRTAAPAALRAFKQGVDHTMQDPALLPTATFVDLRFPPLLVSAVATVAMLTAVWLIANPFGRGGRYDTGVEAMQVLSFLSTLVTSAVAVLCAVAFAFRRARMLAAAYSISALGVAIGILSLTTLAIPERRGFDWRDVEIIPELQVVLPLFIFVTTTALIPAVVAQVMHIAGRRAEIKDDVSDWFRRWGGY